MTGLRVIQEFALAQELLFQIGDLWFDLQVLSDFDNKAQRYAQVGLDTGEFTSVSITGYTTFKENLMFIRRTRRAFDIIIRTYDRAKLFAELVDILFQVRRREVTESRDRIYGLLALINSAFAQPFEPDYTARLRDIFTEFTVRFIRESGSLELLLQSSKQTNSLTELPSWVPDYTSRYNFETERYRADANRRLGFKACGELQCAGLLQASRSLDLPGLFVDQIEHVGTINEYGRGKGDLPSIPLQQSRDWEALCVRVFPDSQKKAYVCGGSIWQAFCRTLFSSRPLEGHQNDSEYIYASFLQECRTENTTPTSAAQALWISIAKRRFIITRNGYVGLGPCDAKQGDDVYILGGGTVPFVLRTTPTSKEFTFVGDCYIEGIMYGEFANQHAPDEIKTVVLV